MLDLNLSHLHYIILKKIILNGFAPSIESLTEIFQRSKEDVIQCLQDLEEYHGVVLHRKTFQIWIIHPFSMSPTNFWVESKKGQWWGNCAWCSLGIAAIINDDVTITCNLGGESKQIKFDIKNNEIITNEKLFVHFPIAMKNAWDNVLLTCSLMQLFQSENEINDWCQRHQYPKGDIQSIEKIWQFAKVWYGNHLCKHWKKWTLSQAKNIFQEFNFNHEIWKLPDLEDSRF